MKLAGSDYRQEIRALREEKKADESDRQDDKWGELVI